MTSAATAHRVMMESCADRQTLVEAAAARIAGNLHEGLLSRGRAGFVATGGRSVGAIYDRLSQAALDWSAVSITLSDERWVDPGSTDSNERLIRTRLMQGWARNARFTPLMSPGSTPDEAASAADRAVGALAWPMDIVLLGMGEDGHIASLFPFNAALGRGLDDRGALRCIAVPSASPAPARARISLTLPTLLSTRAILIVTMGETKRRVLDHALGSDRYQMLPVAAVLQNGRVPVCVLWAS